MSNLKQIFQEFSDVMKQKITYSENMNCDNHINVPEFTNFFTKQGPKLWFSQPEQPHKMPLLNDSGERYNHYSRK